jgi:hypothetical protein
MKQATSLTHLMSAVNNVHDVTDVDTNDNGNNADGADDNPPINAQDTSKGEDAGKRKRNTIASCMRDTKPTSRKFNE